MFLNIAIFYEVCFYILHKTSNIYHIQRDMTKQRHFNAETIIKIKVRI